MVGVGEITGMLSSLNAAIDIAKSMVSLRDTASIQSKVIEFQNAIMDAQQRAFAAQQERATLVEQVSQLEKDVARLKAWNSEKERYDLQRVYPGAFAYVLKPDAAGTQPPHWLCTTCYEKGQKGVLQEQPLREGWKFWRCGHCKNEIKTSRHVAPEAPFVPAVRHQGFRDS